MKGLLLLLLMPVCISAQTHWENAKPVALYPGDNIPNRTGYELQEEISGAENSPASFAKTAHPTITAYLPEGKDADKTAVIIFPGGAYQFLAYMEEGTKIARAFARHGICAFVVKYRLPSDVIMKDKSIGPLQDAQQAIKDVRMSAVALGIDSTKIGIVGFSAGGHVASTAGTHFDSAYIPNIEHTSLRPDFMILVYPVISMTDSLTHIGSRDNLLGANPGTEQINRFSNELHVTDQTPMCWLTHAGDDKLVPVKNSLLFYQALNDHGVMSEMHIFPKGGHSFVLSEPVEQWMQPVFSWMSNMGLLSPR